MNSENKKRAPRNRTITLSNEEKIKYSNKLKKINEKVSIKEILDSTICQDAFIALDFLPSNSVDLIFADPPYNLTKTFNKSKFSKISIDDYEQWLDSWISKLPRILKRTGSIYICGDWRSSASIHRVALKYFRIQNRISWEREKGRGAKNNWKNNCEDIWFCTMSERYTFNVDAVKWKRKVLAPYTHNNREPKDWSEELNGRYRITYPSNIWTDLTVPFWSMPENTDHPTQKPEKLLAKIILASSNEGDIVLDPFVGSGTTSVVAKKLKRCYIGIEVDKDYCCLAEKRLEMANFDNSIQGYSEGVFWERNTFAEQENHREDYNMQNKQQISSR